jgi:GH25 family lysozyme M1 (1,4-beta-N-acetylmuramidase)
MGEILVISHSQSEDIDWKKVRNEVDLVYIRTQFGANNEDTKHKDHKEGCKEEEIPFGEFAFGHFSSVEEALWEANVFIKNVDKQAESLMLQVAEDTIASCGTKHLVEATQSFIDYCKHKGFKTGLFVSASLYESLELNKVKADFLMISEFGSKEPEIKHIFWHYTDSGRIAGYDGLVARAKTTKTSWITKMKRKRKD